MADNSLKNFISKMTGDAFLKIEEDLGEGFVRLDIGEAQRRQAKHDIRSAEDAVIEMLRNSRDAGAGIILIATAADASGRTITVIDDGKGIPAPMHEHVFEPRVTSKLESMRTDSWGVHGRGMALYSIRENTKAARVCSSSPGEGTSIRIDIQSGTLPERKDQSTWPTLSKGDEGRWVTGKGPHNIIRTVADFSLENQQIDVFIGTPNSICATICALALSGNTGGEGTGSLIQSCGLSPDAASLAHNAVALGLDLSERSAYRILSGDIKPLKPVLARLLPAGKQRDSVDIYRDRRGLKIAPSDLEDFSRDMVSGFMPLAQRYFLDLKGDPEITVKGDTINVRFSIEKQR